MKFIRQRILNKIKLHKMLLAGLAAGLLPGSHPVFSVIGGVVGYFLDILFAEAGAEKKIRQFINTPEQGALDEETAVMTAKTLLYIRLMEAEGLTPDFIRNKSKTKFLINFFPKTTRNNRLLDKICQIFPPAPVTKEKKQDEIRTITGYLKTKISRGDAAEVINNFSSSISTEGISKDAFTTITEIIRTWEIPDENLCFSSDRSEDDAEYWKILGLPRGSTKEEIRKTYRKLSGQFHPDTTGVLSQAQQEDAREAFLKIKKSYNYLINRTNGSSQNQ